MQEPKKTINVMQCRSTYTTGGGPDKTVLLIAERSNKEKFRHVLMYMRGANDTDFQIGNWRRSTVGVLFKLNLGRVFGILRCKLQCLKSV